MKRAVTASANFINDGRYIQLNYTVTAGGTAITDGKLAIHADVQIGDNDGAAVEVIQDATGKVIGLKMVDTHTDKSNCLSQNAQFNLYFDGTGGVTPVDTYWFGYFGDRNDSNSTYGYIYFAPLNESTKSSDGTYEQTDGVYTKLSGTDSGFAISWQNINLDAGESKTYSFILGVGEKAEPPEWSDENAVTLTMAADVEQNDRLVNVSAKVKDAAGLTDTLYYSVDGGEGEILGAVAADGAIKEITGQLDLSGYANGVYTFSFWVVNSKGAASSSVEREITITADGITGLDDDAPAHSHTWDTAWTTDETHHWHECTADGCGVTDNSGKDGYAEHVYDDDADTTCNTCGYVRQVGYSISGTVEKENTPVEEAQVTLMQGNTKVAGPVTTGQDGTYTFAGLVAGSYNVVATKDGKTMTILVTVIDENLTNQDLSMPGESVNSVLNVKETPVAEGAAADVTKVVVGGLDSVATAVKTENDTATSVTVTMTVEAKDEATATDDEKAEIDQIKAVATGKILEYVAINMQKTIDNGDPQPITDTVDTVIEIEVPFNFSGKEDNSVTVYRYHGNSVEALRLAQGDAKDRDTFQLDTDNGLIHIYATKFSIYAIGYTVTGQTKYTLTVNGGTGSGSYAAGTIVGISTTVPRNKRFTGWTGATVTNHGSTNTTLVMPAQDTTVTANFQNVLIDWSDPTTYSIETPSVDGGKVTASPKSAASGTTVTLTLTPDQNYTISGVTVTDRNGKQIAVTDKGSGKYTFTMPSGKVTATGAFTKIMGGDKDCPRDNTCPIWPYTDTDLAMWYHDGIHYCVENGLMNGYSSEKFGPNDNLTRAQFAQILHNLEGRPVVNYLLQFEDVSNEAWYTEAVRWAAAQGIVSGYGSGKFGPDDPITREQLAVMLWQYVGSPAATEKELHFTDADKASDYALEALRWVVENGIINGYDDGRLGPQELVTRAQVAQILKGYLEK